MTNEERDYWLRVQARAAQLEPNVSMALLKSLDILRSNFSVSEVARAIEKAGHGPIAPAVFPDTLLDRAFIPYRDAIAAALKRATLLGAKELPDEGKVDGTMAVGFNVLDPNVIDALQTLDDKAINTLAESIRETVTERVQQGLENGESPITMARDLRDTIGVAPNQADAIENFRSMLESGDPGAFDYELRDKRFDATLEKSLGKDATQELTPEQIDKMVDAYGRAMLQFNAETNARTIVLDSMKAGQRLAVDDAVKHGIYDPAYLWKRWRGTLNDREREEHLAMEGQTVAYDDQFSNGENQPGDSTYNCRCVAVYFEAKPEDADSVDDSGESVPTEDGSSDVTAPLEAKGAENDALEKAGFAADSPERRAARRRDRAAARRERGTEPVVAETRVIQPKVEDTPVTRTYDPDATRVGATYRSRPYASQAWEALSQSERELLARSGIAFAETEKIDASGAFFSDVRQTSLKGFETIRLDFKSFKGFATVNENLKEQMSYGWTPKSHMRDVAQHEMGHAIDWSMMPNNIGSYFSTSYLPEAVEWRKALAADLEVARPPFQDGVVNPVEARRAYYQTLRQAYRVSENATVVNLRDENLLLEIAADMIASQKGAIVRERYKPETFKAAFPKSWAVLEHALEKLIPTINQKL